MPDATERLTIEEARARGYLGKGRLRPAPQAGDGPELRKVREKLRRAEALLKLVSTLEMRGHDVRLEHPFHPIRKWRLDVALPSPLIALEIDGYGAAHYGIKGRRNDQEKDAEAALLGWKVFRVHWNHVVSGEALQLIERALEAE